MIIPFRCCCVDVDGSGVVVVVVIRDVVLILTTIRYLRIVWYSRLPRYIIPTFLLPVLPIITCDDHLPRLTGGNFPFICCWYSIRYCWWRYIVVTCWLTKRITHLFEIRGDYCSPVVWWSIPGDTDPGIHCPVLLLPLLSYGDWHYILRYCVVVVRRLTVMKGRLHSPTIVGIR